MPGIGYGVGRGEKKGSFQRTGLHASRILVSSQGCKTATMQFNHRPLLLDLGEKGVYSSYTLLYAETVTGGDTQPIVYSDRGAHYRWPGWLSRVAKANLTRSMSRKACPPENAACEGFFGRLKTEMFYPKDWRSTTIEQFIEALDSYIRWYNDKRIKMSFGYLSPIEYRESLGLTT